MTQTRREWLAGAASALAGVTLSARARGTAGGAKPGGPKVGMCDWSMKRQDPSAFELGRQIGLDGVQVSVGTVENNLWLRQPKVQQRYLEEARKQGLMIPSLALGLLNKVPLMSEPRAALWVADAIEVARVMRVPVILLAFFGKGELCEENETDMRRVAEALKELAPRAAKAGVVLGLESYLSAEGHLKIIDQVQSKAVQVYYDVFNSHVTKGYDFRRELKLLGRDRICEIHFKEGPNLLGSSGKIGWPAVAQVLKEIGYEGWIILETSNPSGHVVSDTKKNLEYTRKLLSAGQNRT